MRHEFIQLAGFAAAIKREGLTGEDVRAIESEIMDNPEAWPVMQGTGGLRKMRFAPASRGAGKSGGIRVCYLVIPHAAHVYLITAFGKNVKGNLSAAERPAIAKTIAAIKRTYKTGDFL